MYDVFAGSERLIRSISYITHRGGLMHKLTYQT